MTTTLILALLAPLVLIDFVFVGEMTLGLLGKLRQQWMPAAGPATVVIPAHNEALVIERTLAALCPATGPGMSILVVADNCTDGTAELARKWPVQVIERADPVNRGKGHALAFARDWLRQDPPQSVIVLDADCRTDGGSLTALASACQQLQRPVQAINLLEPAPSAGPLVQLSCFAFLVKNLVRQRGLQRLAGGVHLTGTGMALPWRLFNGADLATSSIVEDIRLGIELGRAGAHPRLVEESTVWSPHAQQADTIGQRARWEGGFLALAKVAAPELIGGGLRRLSLRTVMAGLDLLVPPLALLAILNFVALVAVTVLAFVGAVSWLPTLILSVAGVLAAAAVLVAWWREGRAFLSPAALARLPFYVMWKIPMYFSFARSGAPKVWSRTQRPGETDPQAPPPSA